MNPGEVHALVAEILGIDIGRVKGDLAFGELAEWDSLNHVNLMVALEERLGVEIEPEQIVELASVAAIEDFTGSQQEISALVSDGEVALASSSDRQAVDELRLGGPRRWSVT